MVDDNASDPTQEESQQKACESLILHDTVSFRLCDNLRLEKQKGAYNRSSTHRKTQTPIVAKQTETEKEPFAAQVVKFTSLPIITT